MDFHLRFLHDVLIPTYQSVYRDTLISALVHICEVIATQMIIILFQLFSGVYSFLLGSDQGHKMRNDIHEHNSPTFYIDKSKKQLHIYFT